MKLLTLSTANKIFKLSENLTTQDVTETFRYIPSSVDAVFTWNDTTYIFKVVKMTDSKGRN